MTAPGNDILLTVLIILFMACTGYAAGRLHQWYRTALERDQAFRDGYDTATKSLFSLAARIIRPRRSDKSAIRGTATVTSILEAPSGANGRSAGRHTVPDELVSGPTYRLTPDRVARAKVPASTGADEVGETTTRVIAVPEPGTPEAQAS